MKSKKGSMKGNIICQHCNNVKKCCKLSLYHCRDYDFKKEKRSRKNKQLKKFRVSFSYEMTGNIEVEAKSQKQAERKLYKDLDYYGLSDLHLINKNDIDNTSREWDIL